MQQAELTRSIEESLAAEDEAADAVVMGVEPAAAAMGDEERVTVEGKHDEL